MIALVIPGNFSSPFSFTSDYSSQKHINGLPFHPYGAVIFYFGGKKAPNGSILHHPDDRRIRITGVMMRAE
jgi:hypothetical protein